MGMLVLLMLLALIPAYIANNKGRSFVGWWLYGLVLLIVALPHAILIQERGQRKCPYCAESIKAEAIACKHCGRALAADTIMKVCTRPTCAKPIPHSVAFCTYCGQPQQ